MKQINLPLQISLTGGRARWICTRCDKRRDTEIHRVLTDASPSRDDRLQDWPRTGMTSPAPRPSLAKNFSLQYPPNTGYKLQADHPKRQERLRSNQDIPSLKRKRESVNVRNPMRNPSTIQSLVYENSNIFDSANTQSRLESRIKERQA